MSDDQVKPVGFKLFLTVREKNELDTMWQSERYHSRMEYLTALVRRDLYGAKKNKYEQNEIPLPGKTPKQYEAEIKHLHRVIQTQNQTIEKLKAQLKQSGC